MEGGIIGAGKERARDGIANSDATDGIIEHEGSIDGGTEFVDPGTLEIPRGIVGGGNDSGGFGASGDESFLAGVDPNPPRKRRKRTKAELEAAGYYEGRREKVQDRVDVDILTWTLMSIHAMVEGATKIPEAALSEEEAKKIAECSARVAQLYTGAVSEKTQAWTALLLALGGVYGSRIVAYVLRKRAEEEVRAEEIRRARQNDPRVVPIGGM